MSLTFQPMMESRPIREIAYEVLKKAIITGEIPAGERIVETDYADRLHISRTPLREALRKLERDGLVDIRPAAQDGRAKVVRLTEAGCGFMEEILPPHYLRVSKLMEKLTETEQKDLILLLKKLSA